MIGWFVGAAFGQGLELPMPSPHAAVEQTVGVVELTVDYSSPGKKDREIWGGLVPYDELWRTGANGATTFAASADVSIGGKTLAAGKYSVFTIPGKDHWTVVFNKDVDASTDEYKEEQDALRLQVDPEKGPARERLTFLFSDTTDAATRLDLEWAGVRVSVPIQVDTAGQVRAAITTYSEDAAGELARAGRWLTEAGDLDRALALLDDSIAIDETWFNVWLKADALHRMNKHKLAYPLAQRALELGNAAGDGFFYKDRVEKALKEWKKR